MKKDIGYGVEQFTSFLKAKGHKATPQRVAVHEAMMVLVHASADMVADYVSTHSDTRIAASSVYNTLSKLSDMGIYARRMSSDSKMYFDLIPFRHLHLYDCESHHFFDIDDKGLIQTLEAALKGRRFKGYTVEDIDVQIICRPTRRGRRKKI